MEIRLATRDDFNAVDEFDIFLGSRITGIERNELWVAIEEYKIIAYMSFNDQFYASLRSFSEFAQRFPEAQRRSCAYDEV